MAGLYIHIPFCREKCLYCDFYSGNQLYLIDEYVEALKIEILLRERYLEGSSIDTIYLGGGTPSILTKMQLSGILGIICKNFVVNSNPEITIECNPEDINNLYVNDLLDLGINRISLGIQFLDNDILKSFRRNHSKDIIFRSLEVIGSSNLENLSVDIIYSVPGIGDDLLRSTLEELIQFDIKHISAYSLTIAANSKLYWKIQNGEYIENKEDALLCQYFLIRDFLAKNGFVQYEISNYARDGYLSRHNLGYWNQVPYLGLGVSAHSYNVLSRQWNGKNIKKYISDLKEGNHLPDFEKEELSDKDQYNEYVLLKLRTLQGLSNNYVKNNFDPVIANHFLVNIKKLFKSGHFRYSEDLILPKNDDLLIADYLAKELMV